MRRKFFMLARSNLVGNETRNLGNLMSIVAGMAKQMTYGLGRAVKGKDE
jgi:hypothetical protein